MQRKGRRGLPLGLRVLGWLAELVRRQASPRQLVELVRKPSFRGLLPVAGVLGRLAELVRQPAERGRRLLRERLPRPPRSRIACPSP